MTIAIRLDDNLVRHAAAEGQVHRRSTPKPIEYWAERLLGGGRFIRPPLTNLGTWKLFTPMGCARSVSSAMVGLKL